MEQQSESRRMKYSLKVIQEVAHPQNMRRMSDPDTFGIVRGGCGDTMEIYLRLDGEKILEATFMTNGRESAIACGNMLTTMVRGLTMEEAGKISSEELIAALGGLPESKRHCAGLTVSALQAAFASWFAQLHSQERTNVRATTSERR